MMAVRARRLNVDENERLDVKVERRSLIVGLGGGARKAMEKRCSSEGEEGVTMMAGRGDFSDTSGRERSRGAGMRV